MNMTHPVRAIVFDFGNVLIDWNPRYLFRKMFADDAAVEQFMTEVGFHEWNLEQDKGRPFAEAISRHATKYPHYAEHITAYFERYPETVGGELSETVAILRALKRAGYPIYGLSNWSAETFARIRGEYDFLNLFDGIVLSGEVKLIKPDPRIFDLVLQKAGLPAAECLFVDDMEPNITAARALGFQTVLFTSAQELARELDRLGVKY